jgi:uncharacterized membrane protein
VSVTRAEHFSGPLPSPETLRQYDLVVPGMAKALVGEWAAQGAHRRALEEAVVMSNVRQANRAQWLAFILALAVLIVGVVFMAADHAREGAGLIAAVLVGLVTVFLTGKHQQTKDLERKQEE